MHISRIKESFLLAIISEETTLQSHSLDFGSFDVVYEEHKSLEDPFRVSGAKGVCLTGRLHKNGKALFLLILYSYILYSYIDSAAAYKNLEI